MTAVTADKVQVRLEAETQKYVTDLLKADKTFESVVKKMNANAKASGAAFTRVAQDATGAFKQIADDAAKSAGSMQMNTANIAAQFQDIGVTAAMGMNPMMIALQQGTQLSAVLNASVAAGQSPVKALGSAFLSVINPVSLATIAIIALGAAGLQALGGIIPKSEDATEAIKRHRDALEEIVTGYQNAEQAVADYFDAANRLPQGVATARTQEQFTKMGEEAERFRQRAEQIGSTLDGIGSAAEQKLGQAARAFASGEITAEQFYSALQDVKNETNALENALSFIPGGIQGITREMEEGALKAIAFGDAIRNLVAASQIAASLAVDADLQNVLDLRSYIAEQERLNGLTSEQLDIETRIARIKRDAGELGITDERAAELAREALAADERRAAIKKQMASAGKADNSAAREYEREREAIEKLLETMGFEAALLGQTNREKAIAVALSKANATATEEERTQIAQMAAYIYDTEQAIKTLNDTSEEWAKTMQGATRGFIDDLLAGKDAAEAFGNVLSKLGSKLIDLGLSNLFGSSGFNLGGLFGGGGGFPTRAMGGNVYAGQPTMINERGQEIFVPTQPGKMIPASQVGGGGSVTFAPQIDARGADVAAVARLEQSMQRLAQEIVPTIRREISQGPKKGRR